MHFGSLFIRSAARLKWLVLLSYENTSVYRSATTAPCIPTMRTMFLVWCMEGFGEVKHTVKATPAITTTRLIPCCVVLAAFSRALSSPHRTRPSSFTTVTCLRLVEPVELAFKLLCAVKLREKTTRTVERGNDRLRHKEERRRRDEACGGLCIAFMVGSSLYEA
jgi:hypothetical protein